MPNLPYENLPDYLTREIAEKIIRNELKPRERILEARIAADMGVSRSPVREALRVLEKNRLVELIPRKGARVTEITAAHIEWLFDIFEALYGMVARRAAQHADAADRRRMEATLETIETAAGRGDVPSYFEAIFAFAEAGLQAARNPLLESLVRELWPANRRIQYASLGFRADELRRNVAYFRRTAERVLLSDADGAESVIREYARNEKAFALAVVNQQSPEAN